MAEAKQDMLPDSTQGETPDQKKGTKRKGSKDGKKKRKVAKKKSKVGGKGKIKNDQGSDVDSDLDLNKEKQPLEFYLNDREELLNEAFNAVKGLQLTSMVPDILKYVPLDELKRLCLNQLEGMSRKRIRHVIQGTEMLSSSDSDESAPEDEIAGVTMTTASVQADVDVKGTEEKKDLAEMEMCVDSTVKPVTQPEATQKGADETKTEDIDGVPVEIDVNIEELVGKSETQAESSTGKTSTGNTGSKPGTKPSKDANKAKKTAEKHSDQVSSSHHRSRSRSPRRRRRRSWSSRSRSRDRYSRSGSRGRYSRSRSRSRSWSSRSRSRSWSRSWSRSSRSRSRSRSRSPGRKDMEDPAMSPSPPPPPPQVDAIQMRYPTPPTPSGSLSSGEIREILELESESEEEEQTVEDGRFKEEEIRRKLEGLVGIREGLDNKVSGKVMSESVSSKIADAPDPSVDDAVVVQSQGGPVECITSVSKSTEDCKAGNDDAESMETCEMSGTHLNQESCEEGDEDDGDDDGDDDDDDESSDDEDDSDDESDDSEDNEDEDINLDLLDLGVDISKAAGQPSQLALARASVKPPPTSNTPDKNKDSGEAELEVLELELRARAIRSLMHKCLKEDDKG